MARLRDTRDWFVKELATLDIVAEVCPSDANFVFVCFRNAKAVLHQAKQLGLLLRDYPDASEYAEYLRISIGERHVMDKLLVGLKNLGGAS